MSKKAGIFASLQNMQREREQRERQKATQMRNIANGRCGDCRKKLYDCRCKVGDE